MRLYHFTDKELKILSPEFLGYNTYTKKDSQFPCKRFFCYDTPIPAEDCFKFSKYRYTIRIKDKYIYNLDNDVLNLKERFSFDIDKILDFLSKKHHAVIYSTSFKTYAIFKPYKIFERENLILGKEWN